MFQIKTAFILGCVLTSSAYSWAQMPTSRADAMNMSYQPMDLQNPGAPAGGSAGLGGSGKDLDPDARKIISESEFSFAEWSSANQELANTRGPFFVDCHGLVSDTCARSLEECRKIQSNISKIRSERRGKVAKRRFLPDSCDKLSPDAKTVLTCAELFGEITTKKIIDQEISLMKADKDTADANLECLKKIPAAQWSTQTEKDVADLRNAVDPGSAPAAQSQVRSVSSGARKN